MYRISLKIIVGVVAGIGSTGCQRPQPVEVIARTEKESTARTSIEKTSITAPPTVVSGTDWPWWGGPNRDRTVNSVDIPTEWSPTQNVLWVTPIPGKGHSSPCVHGNRVFVTTADDSNETQRILCLDRETGQTLWDRELHVRGFMKLHQKNSHASATPACDGTYVYTACMNGDSIHVSAVDMNGKIQWQKPAGSYGSEHGYGSSPVLFKGSVFVLADNLTGSFVAALDCSTGDVTWRTARRTTGRHGSYATPTIAELCGRPQLVMSGMSQVQSFDPRTGKLLWTCDGPSEVAACTVATSGDLVIASGGYPEKEILAIRADGSGDVTQSHVLWRADRGVTYVPSPLVYQDHLYVVDDDGVASCFRLADGEQIAQKRLGGKFSGSPVLVGDRFYVTNEAGVTYVVKADPDLEIIAKNDLADGGLASPVISGNRLLLRTNQQLYCIGR
ncbi:MAG: PQQ-binding-like beta-propeller repeat protein [Planctomycetota bacterium]|nr:PQQ-binding-like beta-propeller repeat protein [Planctomycetota bacterium]